MSSCSEALDPASPPFRKEGCALVLLGHGSTKDPHSSESTRALAGAIGDLGIFGEVHCAFWKEKPGFRDMEGLVERDEVYLVPHFISEGYYTREVIPRELGLRGPSTERGGKVFRYCDPVGGHPGVTDLLRARAVAALEEGDGVDGEKDCALLLVGHGTERNPRSADAVREQARRIAENPGPFAEIRDLYLDEEPRLAGWREAVEAPQVVVVPCLIADGMHARRDIPRLLGLPVAEPEAGEAKAVAAGAQSSVMTGRSGGRQILVTGALGADPAMREIALEQVAAFDARYLRGQ